MKIPMKFLLPLIVCILLVPSLAFAQGAPASPASPITWVQVLAALVGFLTMAYNTGSVFGLKTIPKPALPFIGFALTFFAGAAQNLGGTIGFSAAALEQAGLAGFWAILGNGAGAAAHVFLTAHLSSRGVAAKLAGMGGGSGPGGGGVAVKVNAVEAEAVKLAAPATKREPYRPMPQMARAAFFSLAFKRWMRRLVPAAIVVGMFAIGASTGGSCSGPTPATAAQIAAAEKLAVCSLDVYLTDSQKTPPPAALQIGLDIAGACGADVPDLVNSFATAPTSAVASSSAPTRAQVVAAAQANPAMIHTAVLAWKQNQAAIGVAAPAASGSAAIGMGH